MDVSIKIKKNLKTSKRMFHHIQVFVKLYKTGSGWTTSYMVY